MLISVENRFVFVANSKTASTSIEKALIPFSEIHRGGPAHGKHIRLRQVFPDYDFLFGQENYAPATFFKFGVMRDPIDWVQSWYRYRMGMKRKRKLADGTTFEQFWQERAAAAKKNGKKRLQSEYFLRPNGDLLADYIIPYDGLADHFNMITDKLGVEAGLPKANVSEMKKIAGGLSKDVADEIREFHAEDYALFNRLDEINAAGLEHLEATRAHARAP